MQGLTKVLTINHCRNVQYIERDGTEHFHTLKSFPESLTKKVTLLKYFRNYMSEHLLKVSAQVRSVACRQYTLEISFILALVAVCPQRPSVKTSIGLLE